MNVIKHRCYTLEFDVWEPLEKKVDAVMIGLVDTIKQKLEDHAAKVHLRLESETRMDS